MFRPQLHGISLGEATRGRNWSWKLQQNRNHASPAKEFGGEERELARTDLLSKIISWDVLHWWSVTAVSEIRWDSRNFETSHYSQFIHYCNPTNWMRLRYGLSILGLYKACTMKITPLVGEVIVYLVPLTPSVGRESHLLFFEK